MTTKLRPSNWHEAQRAQELFDQGKARGSDPPPTEADLIRRRSTPARPRLAQGFPSSTERQQLLDADGRLRHRAVGAR